MHIEVFTFAREISRYELCTFLKNIYCTLLLLLLLLLLKYYYNTNIFLCEVSCVFYEPVLLHMCVRK
jgi:predicted CDP-diglyceride synthetase/phosphatidate cytidylyltransferase